MVTTARAALPLLALLAFALAPRLAAADPEPQSDDPSRIDLTVKRVVVFKDGYALFVREGKGMVGADGRLRTNDVPDSAVLGTFWALGDKERPLGMEASLRDREETVETTEACVEMRELLAANAGRTVRLVMADDTPLVCVIKGVLDREQIVASPTASRITVYRSATIPEGQEGETVQLLRRGTYVHVQVDDGQLVIPVAEIKMFGGQQIATTTQTKTKRTWNEKELAFVFGAERAGQEATVTVMHFGPGLRWIPTYRVTGDLVDTATLSLQAELLNESIALEDTPGDLVVGVPHFEFSEVVSPLVLEAALRNALVEAAPALMAQNSLSNASFGSRAGERVRADSGGMDMAPELATESAQDLFVYSLPALRLPKGGRAAMPLWQTDVPLGHLYTLDLDLARDGSGGAPYVRSTRERGRGRRETSSPLELAQLSVWHQLELTNTSSWPWTTGAAITMKGLLPVGQDMLTYTPRGGTTLLPLTLAVDMRANVQEEELSREPDQVVWQGNRYMRLVKRCTVQVSSFRDAVSATRVRVSLGGRVLEVSDGGTKRINDFRPEDWTRSQSSYGVNNHSDVEWRIDLKPGDVKKLTLTYELYVR